MSLQGGVTELRKPRPPGATRTHRPPRLAGRSTDNRSTPARRSGCGLAGNCCGRGCTDRTALPLSYRSSEAPGGSRTRDRRLGVDNRTRSGPQQVVRRGRVVRSGADSNRGAPGASPDTLLLDNRAAPARDDLFQAGPPGIEPGPARLELAVLPVTPRTCEADDPDRTGLPGLAARCSAC